MLRDSDLKRVVPALPFMASASADLVRDFLSEASIRAIPAPTQIFVEGDECGAIAILLSGTVRVFKVGETGREITLYRFDRGESCILTANCILGNRQFPAIAVVERDAEAIVIPATAFRDWVNRYEPWRDYVFDLLSRRLATVMAVVDEVAFRRMDARIADFLARRLTSASPSLRITHQEIAAELGTSREVVSRILEDFTEGRLIETGRGAIRLLDHAGLMRRARSA
ncbi:MAG: Crp/Fnr family transcriptional regulator [Anaerolineae bacterium]|jgi:CRP/FNR family transcriptional regulator|nr:Crp/Fnr family transcriptional regulator [Anaerolineae bacterium]